MKHSRKALFQKLGVTPTNERWSWCAMDAHHREAHYGVNAEELEHAFLEKLRNS